MGTRRQARIAAFQALYAWEESHPELDELLRFGWMEGKPDDKTLIFASMIVGGTVENLESVDEYIRRHLKNWSFERLTRVDLAILRTSAYALVYQKDIPYSVTIDEAVEIAKKYGSPESFRFVNGVLDGIRKATLS